MTDTELARACLEAQGHEIITQQNNGRWLCQSKDRVIEIADPITSAEGREDARMFAQRKCGIDISFCSEDFGQPLETVPNFEDKTVGLLFGPNCPVLDTARAVCEAIVEARKK